MWSKQSCQTTDEDQQGWQEVEQKESGENVEKVKKVRGT